MSTASTFDANTADTRQIAQWLEIGLDGYIKDDMGRWAFRPLERYIGVRDDLVDDLCAIYDSLTASAQARWRSAICNVLAIHGRDISKRKMTRVLITFAVLVRSSEVLDVLPGILPSSEDDDLLDQAVGAAVALAGQTEASRRCLERIRTSPAFTSHYAGLILVALCHADPDNWLRHVEDLGVAMRKLANRLSPDSTALRFYASNILDAISLSRISAPVLNQLATESVESAAWIHKEWLEGNRSLLRLHPTAAGVRLMLRADNSVSADLEGLLDETVLKAQGVQICQKTAIAWERQESRKMWVAVCTSGFLTELTPVQPSWDALAAFINPYLSEQNAVQWRQGQLPKHGGIVFGVADESLPISSGDDLSALWDRKIADGFTKRVDYLKEYRQHVQPTFRRLAFDDRGAFGATASALALASSAA